MLIPKVTCLPSYDTNLICVFRNAEGRALGGKPGGLLYTEPAPRPTSNDDSAITAAASLQQSSKTAAWTKWFMTPSVDNHNNNNNNPGMVVSSAAQPSLTLGLLFGEPDFGIDPAVALPLLWQETPTLTAGVRAGRLASAAVGKQLASSPNHGALYTQNTGDTTASTTSSSSLDTEATWTCEWQTAELCALINADTGTRVNWEVPPSTQGTANIHVIDHDDLVAGGGGMAPPVPRLSMAHPYHATSVTTHWRFVEAPASSSSATKSATGDNNYVMIQSHDGKYCLGDSASMTGTNTVTCTPTDTATLAPTWKVVRTSTRGVVIQSTTTQRYLTVSQDKHTQQQYLCMTAANDKNDGAHADPSSRLWCLEPVHGSKFHIENVAHAARNDGTEVGGGSVAAAKKDKAVDVDKMKGFLDNVSVKVFDNGSVVIKRDGQYFGECFWKDTFIGIGFGQQPTVWQLEATPAGPVRIMTTSNNDPKSLKNKGGMPTKRYLYHDGTTFALGHYKAGAAGSAATTDDKSYLWNIRAVQHEKYTTGIRYGILPRNLEKQARAKWNGALSPFVPTLAMEGELQRPFSNWKAWPIVAPSTTTKNNGEDDGIPHVSSDSIPEKIALSHQHHVEQEAAAAAAAAASVAAAATPASTANVPVVVETPMPQASDVAPESLQPWPAQEFLQPLHEPEETAAAATAAGPVVPSLNSGALNGGELDTGKFKVMEMRQDPPAPAPAPEPELHEGVPKKALNAHSAPNANNYENGFKFLAADDKQMNASPPSSSKKNWPEYMNVREASAKTVTPPVTKKRVYNWGDGSGRAVPESDGPFTPSTIEKGTTDPPPKGPRVFSVDHT